MDDLVAKPHEGRCFRASRTVRLGDADARGRLRLDALARLLQDVGNDDFADAGLDPGSPWVARRTTVEAQRWPLLGDRMALATWCGGLGSRWAERRTSVTTNDGARVEVAALWVAVDGRGRPCRLPPWFLATYGPAAGGRSVSSRLHHAGPPPGTDDRAWALRATDVDVLGHVNNAATWAAVEDEALRRGVTPARAALEYHAALDPGDEVLLRSAAGDGGGEGGGGVRLWLTVGDQVRASAVLLPLPLV